MRSTLEAISKHPKLSLRIIATGMHLSAAHGRTIKSIRRDGFCVDATVPWKTGNQSVTAVQTGRAMAGIAKALEKLRTDIVLIAGDRVEAFAAAAAGHIAGQVVAHVHGGDRALGQVDDSLRHAITKLAHIHFPATAASRLRILRLGEDSWRVHRVGSPGADGIAEAAEKIGNEFGRFALVVLHPTQTNEKLEYHRAKLVLSCVRRIGFDRIVIVYPNNDPGSAGIIRCWQETENDPQRRICVLRNVQRTSFLAMMRDAAVLIGNSSSGIIEAASFGTPVIDIGPRQNGRERSANAVNVPFVKSRIDPELQRVWNNGVAIRYAKRNVYGGDGAGEKIAEILCGLRIDAKITRKLIGY